MKVLIIPYYLYTHYQTFKVLSEELESYNISVKFFYIRGVKSIDEYNKIYLDQIPPDKLVQPKTINLGTKTDIFSRSIRLIKYLYNFYEVKLKLYSESPDLIILGSDAGGIYIRKVQEILQKRNIPIVVLQGVMFLPIKERKELEINYSQFTKKVFDILGLRKVFTNICDVPGMYLPNNYIFALGKTSKSIFESFGKKPCLIFETGNPSNDQIKIAIKDKCGNNNSEIKELLKIDTRHQYVIYFTEMIQEINGEAYFDDFNIFLKEICDKLPKDIFLVIKPHPRENEYTIKKLSRLFKGDKYRFIYNADNNALIYSSLLSVAHTSTVLFNAILLNKPILSINFNKTNCFYQFPENVVVKNKEEFLFFINSFLNNKEFKQNILKYLMIWKENNIYNSRTFDSTIQTAKAVISILEGKT